MSEDQLPYSLRDPEALRQQLARCRQAYSTLEGAMAGKDFELELLRKD